jgi:hypothetical protein
MFQSLPWLIYIKDKKTFLERILVHPVNEYAARQNMLAGLKVETVFS